MSHRLWTPAFVGLMLANFCSSMIFYLLVPTLANHAVVAYGASPAEGGALASIFFIGALLARLFSGRLVERLGPRRMAVWGSVFYLVTTLAYLVAPTLVVMMAVRLLNGVGFGLLGSALMSGVMLTVPAARRAEGAGWFSLGISAAIGLGPFAALTLANGPLGMTAVFVAAAVSAGLAVVLLALFGRGLPESVPVPDGGPVRGGLLDRRALGMGTVMLLGGFAYSAVLAFLDPATRGTDLARAASFFFLVYAVGVVVIRPTMGMLQDRVGERPVLLPATIVFAIAMAVIASADTGWALLAGSALLTLGFGTISAGGQAASVSRVPRERTGAAVATHFFMLDLGTGLGPILLGLLVSPLGYRGVFWVAAVMALATLPVYWVDVSRQRRGGPRAA